MCEKLGAEIIDWAKLWKKEAKNLNKAYNIELAERNKAWEEARQAKAIAERVLRAERERDIANTFLKQSAAENRRLKFKQNEEMECGHEARFGYETGMDDEKDTACAMCKVEMEEMLDRYCEEDHVDKSDAIAEKEELLRQLNIAEQSCVQMDQSLTLLRRQNDRLLKELNSIKRKNDEQ